MRRFSFCCAILIVLCSPVALVHADSPAPEYDYIVEVGDAGEYIFVMLAVPDDETAYGQGGWEQDEEIRAEYEQSGLYRSGETEEAIWTVDWYAFAVYITPDGKHLVRWGPWAFTPNYNELALEFYENGNLLRSYRVSDLVAEPERLPETESHYSWGAEAEFNGEKRELYLRTNNGEEYVFDVTTGDIISESEAPTAQPTPTLTIAQPTATPATAQPTATAAIAQPTATPAIAQPTATPATAQPTPTPAAAQPTATPAAALLAVVIGAIVVLGLAIGYFIRQKTRTS